jgi:acyl dehydratase
VTQLAVSYRVRARNSATASENKIHDDAVARQHGFGGGLVPGVAVFAYMTRAPLQWWNERWIETGCLRARFLSPVYDGEAVTVEMDEDGALRVINAAGETCATGQAELTSLEAPPADVIPATPLPDLRPPASEETLAVGTVLGTIEAGFHAERAEEYLSSIGDDSEIYREQGLAHPGWLLQWANTALVANVQLGPWIHVESDATIFRPVHDGEIVATRARVEELFERKGHQFVVLDVLTLGDGKPAMRVRHVAIWLLRSTLRITPN